MKTPLKWLLAIAITTVFCSPAYAGWQERIAKNQVKAIEYISKLKAGADPDNVKRPKLRRDEKARAAKANREIREAMTEAEKLARSGKNRSIKVPQFKTKLVSEKRFNSIKKEHAQRDS